MVSTDPVLATIDEDNIEVEVKSETKTEEYQDYSKTIHGEDEPKLITLRGTNVEYLEARRKISRFMRRAYLHKDYLDVNDTKFKVTNLQAKTYSVEVDLETVENDGKKGKVKLTVYKDNKKKTGKKEQTIMISKKARNDSRYLEIMSKNIVQYLLEGFIRKEIVEEDLLVHGKKNQNMKFECDVCSRDFVSKHALTIHMSKAHTKKVEQIEKHTFTCTFCGDNLK